MAVTVEPEQFDLGSVHSGLLDCIQVNLAVLADHHYGPGAHLRLGARLDFGSWAGADGLPTVDPPLTAQLTTATGLLGLRVASRERLTRGELLAALRKDGGVRYVVADAYLLPWLPYHRHAHMEHSFLMAAGPDGWHITDAYRSDTAWGTATPGHWVLADDDLAELASAEVIELVPVGARPVDALPPAHTADPAAVAGYLAAYDACADRARAVDQLTVETWLLARARKLHAAYRALFARGAAEAAAERAHLRAWDKVVEQTYLAHRRVSRGRAEPPGVVDRLREALAADLTVFGSHPTASPAAPGPAPAAEDALRRRVAAVAGAVLGVPPAALLDGSPFDSFASFSSFRLIEIIERLESELGTEFDADDLVPANLRRVDDLCRIAH
ncbi:phosphopantetheine-binding protein [Streptomyces lydicus]|uniref:phosphopantetheine-binding protein n=1 Tax=Streptomyces lydicus TaxID=47763 RepID=UPI0036E79219